MTYDIANTASGLASLGRGDDSMMVHMTPSEVQALQTMAESHGGSLTINPQTGLPEAGFLKKLLPVVAGLGLSLIPGVGPLLAAGLVGGGTTLATGSLKKGLFAGLGAYGGAGLGTGFMGMANPITVPTASQVAAGYGGAAPSVASNWSALGAGAKQAVTSGFKSFTPNAGLLGTGGSAAVKAGLAGLVGGAGFDPAKPFTPIPVDDKPYGAYSGPYRMERTVRYPTAEELARDEEFLFFGDDKIINSPTKSRSRPKGRAAGGYLQGPGDGMSDGIPAVISHRNGKSQAARLAAGEFIVPADVVSHIGNGSSDAGAQRLYSMMDRVREARTGNPKQGKQINSRKYLPA